MNPSISIYQATHKILKALAAMRGVSIAKVVEDLTERAAEEKKEELAQYFKEKAARAKEFSNQFIKAK